MNYKHEIDYRCNENGISQQTRNQNFLYLAIIAKMKKIGKLFKSEKTVLDINTSTDQMIAKVYNNVESIGGFASIRANNCFISGRWVYETQLFSHKLAQIGWVIYYITLVSD